MAGSDPDPSSYIAGRQINPRFARIIIILCIGYKLLIFIQSLKVDYLINNRCPLKVLELRWWKVRDIENSRSRR